MNKKKKRLWENKVMRNMKRNKWSNINNINKKTSKVIFKFDLIHFLKIVNL